VTDQVKAERVPLVSVLIPTYNNNLHYLQLALTSILQQTFTDFEMLLVDDGNKPECIQYMQELEQKDARVHLLQRNGKDGLPGALNYGLQAARGKIIARMDADDVALPERFQKQIAYLQAHPEVDVLGTNMRVIDSDGKVIGALVKHSEPDEVKRNAYWKSPVAHPSVMFKKDKILSVGGYNVNFKMAEDLDLWLRALKHGIVIASLPDFLMQYRIEANTFERRGPKTYWYDYLARKQNFVFTIPCITKLVMYYILYVTFTVLEAMPWVSDHLWHLLRWVYEHRGGTRQY